MKKTLLLLLLLITGLSFRGFSQTTHDAHGVVADSTGITIPGVVVKLKSDQDSMATVTNIDGLFTFSGVKAQKFAITYQSIGYQGLKRNYVFVATIKSANLGIIKLHTEAKMLGVVNIVDVNAVKIKEDTTVYNAAAYPVRANATTEEVLKKLPGVDVDANGNVTAEGTAVTKVRINGKDFFGGDVQTATKNLPADVIESIEMIDDYGDQANITGIKSGTPTKVMNIVIRKDRNHGYTIAGTAGIGRDLLPSGEPESTRYTASTNSFTFRGDEQIALLGSINNNNTNTFNFGGGGGGGAAGGFGGGGGGGRGNAARTGGGGAAAASTTASTANGITDAKSIGLNFRDQWGKTLSVYGSYSFADNSTNILSNTLQKNNTNTGSINNNSNSNETDGTLNHRVTWNMEWKPDTSNYVKFTPTYSYGNTTTNAYDNNLFSTYTDSTQRSVTYLNYINTTTGSTNTQSYGATILFNHKFPRRHNFSITANGSSSPNTSFSNPINVYLVGRLSTPQNLIENVDSRTNSVGSTVSYILPVSKFGYLEGNYTFSYAYTTNDKVTDSLVYQALNTQGPSTVQNFDAQLSNIFNYSFITNRFALNYRVIKQKYNFTIGVGIQPADLKATTPATATAAAINTDISTVNFSPTLRYVYNFSRTQAFTLNYSGNNVEPTYTELNPFLDVSNASYPVQGNPNLKPAFSNTVAVRYNQFDIGSGNIFFSNASFTQFDNQIVSNSINYPRVYKPNLLLDNAILTTYTNASGYYSANGFVTFAKPWEKRKYTLILTGNASFTNNIAYITSIDSATYKATSAENVAKTLVLTPSVRFRLDITDVIDAQASGSYGVTRTTNTLATAPYSDYRTTILGLNGKNYFFKDWTVSYDYSKTIYQGYTGNIVNPNILTTYLERRFLKNNAATIRATVYDVFNQNTGYTNTTTGTQTTSSMVNRLGRYYLLTFTLRLQKFAGKAPVQDFGPGGGRRNGGFGGGNGGPGGGGGGNGGPPPGGGDGVY